jgi:hypothetical protein
MEEFKYEPGLSEQIRAESRRRMIFLWPPFGALLCGPALYAAIDEPQWLCFGLAIACFIIVCELLWRRQGRVAASLSRTLILYDEPSHALIWRSPEGDGEQRIDLKRRYKVKWSDISAGNFFITVHQGNASIRIASRIEGARRLITEILELDWPDSFG